MDEIAVAFRVILTLARHPAVQAASKYVVRQATAALIRAVRNKSRRSKSL